MFNFIGSIFHKIASVIVGGLLLVGVGHHAVVNNSISASSTIAAQNISTSTDSEISDLQTSLAQEKATEIQLEQKINSISQTQQTSNISVTQTSQPPQNQQAEDNNLSGAQIYSLVSPSVAYITWSDSKYNYGGSGFVVNDGKYTVTNAHVLKSQVTGAYTSTVQLQFKDGTTFTGYVLGYDAGVDLAVIYNVQSTEPPAKLGTSDDSLEVGTDVYALGYPETFDGLSNQTFTNGTLSAKQESPAGYSGELLQTDAAINHGNSGGPLVNNKGEVVGVNTLTLNNAQGIYFAIPIDTVEAWIPKLSQYGQSRYEIYPIGSTQNITAQEQEKIDLNPKIDCTTLFTSSELTTCNLYKSYKGDYNWNVTGSLSNY